MTGVQTCALPILLEGVEEPSQLTAARQAGATFAQGLLVGAPAPAGAQPSAPASGLALLG